MVCIGFRIQSVICFDIFFVQEIGECFAALPTELLCHILSFSGFPLSAYATIVGLSHKIRQAFRGKPRVLSRHLFDDIDIADSLSHLPRREHREPVLPPVPVDSFALLIGPCRNLQVLELPPLLRCGRERQKYMPWVESAFAHHPDLRALWVSTPEGLPTAALSAILTQLPRLESLALLVPQEHEWLPEYGWGTLPAIISSCPGLHSLFIAADLPGVDARLLPRLEHLQRLVMGPQSSRNALLDADTLAALTPRMERLSGQCAASCYGLLTVDRLRHLFLQDCASRPQHECRGPPPTLTHLESFGIAGRVGIDAARMTSVMGLLALNARTLRTLKCPPTDRTLALNPLRPPSTPSYPHSPPALRHRPMFQASCRFPPTYPPTDRTHPPSAASTLHPHPPRPRLSGSMEIPTLLILRSYSPPTTTALVGIMEIPTPPPDRTFTLVPLLPPSTLHPHPTRTHQQLSGIMEIPALLDPLRMLPQLSDLALEGECESPADMVPLIRRMVRFSYRAQYWGSIPRDPDFILDGAPALQRLDLNSASRSYNMTRFTVDCPRLEVLALPPLAQTCDWLCTGAGTVITLNCPRLHVLLRVPPLCTLVAHCLMPSLAFVRCGARPDEPDICQPAWLGQLATVAPGLRRLESACLTDPEVMETLCAGKLVPSLRELISIRVHHAALRGGLVAMGPRIETLEMEIWVPPSASPPATPTATSGCEEDTADIEDATGATTTPTSSSSPPKCSYRRHSPLPALTVTGAGLTNLCLDAANDQPPLAALTLRCPVLRHLGVEVAIAGVTTIDPIPPQLRSLRALYTPALLAALGPAPALRDLILVLPSESDESSPDGIRRLCPREEVARLLEEIARLMPAVERLSIGPMPEGSVTLAFPRVTHLKLTYCGSLTTLRLACPQLEVLFVQNAEHRLRAVELACAMPNLYGSWGIGSMIKAQLPEFE
ncbi:hypothetical protein PAPYR_6877 [Paratrimastix pyriformis]|uniref:F-box domain-containing protein n=1 Tax=Paratrimastix pyriformis TaxID=342808 RepID=A0ABQ8UGU0_9EUKA|nr:hypothetical protein PAPYR_6877 [Paratrimastix pyriformis]